MLGLIRGVLAPTAPSCS